VSLPQAPRAIRSFTELALASGVRRLVMLSGRGEETAEVIELLTYLFTTVLDGRNARVTDGVRRALGREPRDFADYARDAAATGVWDV
jgi:hypothetical protein